MIASLFILASSLLMGVLLRVNTPQPLPIQIPTQMTVQKLENKEIMPFDVPAKDYDKQSIGYKLAKFCFITFLTIKSSLRRDNTDQLDKSIDWVRSKFVNSKRYTRKLMNEAFDAHPRSLVVNKKIFNDLKNSQNSYIRTVLKWFYKGREDVSYYIGTGHISYLLQKKGLKSQNKNERITFIQEIAGQIAQFVTKGHIRISQKTLANLALDIFPSDKTNTLPYDATSCLRFPIDRGISDIELSDKIANILMLYNAFHIDMWRPWNPKKDTKRKNPYGQRIVRYDPQYFPGCEHLGGLPLVRECFLRENKSSGGFGKLVLNYHFTKDPFYKNLVPSVPSDSRPLVLLLYPGYNKVAMRGNMESSKPI